MAKRKAAAGRKSAARGRGGATKKKAAAGPGAKRAGRKATARRTKAKKTAKRKATARKTSRKAAVRKSAPRRNAKQTARRQGARKTKTAGAARRARTPAASARKTAPGRKAPALNRTRRTVREDEDLVDTPPSSLDLDRSASSARSGRRELHERYTEHTETGPAITGGDVDADWESAYSVGDEAPGGDNPTPDQDIVDDIGRAVGIEYQDTEELKGADKLSRRDKNRWELDPASSEDWDER